MPQWFLQSKSITNRKVIVILIETWFIYCSTWVLYNTTVTCNNVCCLVMG